MIGPHERLTHFRTLVEGSKIRVEKNDKDLPLGGLTIVPVQFNMVRLFYRQVYVCRLHKNGIEWYVADRDFPFSSLPAAAFAAVANHLCHPS